MAGYTIGDIVDTFFVMFGSHAGGAMFVAAIASVCRVIIIGMADYAFGIVVAVEDKVIVMCKGRGYPLCGTMAFVAVVRSLLMHFISRCFVA